METKTARPGGYTGHHRKTAAQRLRARLASAVSMITLRGMFTRGA